MQIVPLYLFQSFATLTGGEWGRENIVLCPCFLLISNILHIDPRLISFYKCEGLGWFLFGMSIAVFFRYKPKEVSMNIIW